MTGSVERCGRSVNAGTALPQSSAQKIGQKRLGPQVLLPVTTQTHSPQLLLNGESIASNGAITQKNGRVQEIPMLPGLEELLSAIPMRDRTTGWVVDPLLANRSFNSNADWFRPTDADLKHLAEQFSNASIARV